MTALIVVSSSLRYFVGAPVNFTEELAGLLACTAAMLAMPLALVRGEHIRIGLVVDRLRGSWRRVADFAGIATAAVFLVIFGLESADAVRFSIRFNARSEVASLTLWPWMLLLPGVSATLLCSLVPRLINLIRRKQ